MPSVHKMVKQMLKIYNKFCKTFNAYLTILWILEHKTWKNAKPKT